MKNDKALTGTLKHNQTIKFNQLVEYNMRNIFLTNHEKIGAGRLVLDLILFFEKVLHQVKASGQHLSFSIFW